jgi:hypothetical protein
VDAGKDRKGHAGTREHAPRARPPVRGRRGRCARFGFSK